MSINSANTPHVPRTAKTSVDPATLSLRGRIGAHRLHATHDPRETTANARAAFLSRFEAEVDPDGVLPPEERSRRALHARKAYFQRLALKSAQARAKKRAKRNGSTGKVMPSPEVQRDADASQ